MIIQDRIVAISHGNKKVSPDMLDGAAEAGSDDGSPTIVHIRLGEQTSILKLEDDDVELLFLTGLYPMSWRPLREGEDASTFHGVHTRKVRRGGKSIVEVVDEVGGIQAGDIILTPLGGSGPELQHALTKRISALNEANGTSGRMFRTPWFRLHDQIKARELVGEPRVHAPEVLIDMYLSSVNTEQFKQWFYEPTESDQSVMKLVERRRGLDIQMRARIQTSNRLYAHYRGQVYADMAIAPTVCTIKEEVSKRIKRSIPFQALVTIEKEILAQVQEVLESLPVYQEILSKVKGIGPAYASRLIAAIQTPRRFRSASALVAYLGVHVVKGKEGKMEFPRRKRGERANWQGEWGRKTLYLMIAQWVKLGSESDEPWAVYFRTVKAEIAAKNPDWSKGQIHNAARWRTATRFVEWFYGEWNRLRYCRYKKIPFELRLKVYKQKREGDQRELAAA